MFRHYRSLSEFFTRSIKEDCREISPECIVSPCDGRVLHLGPVTGESHTEQVKGVTYSLEAFLGPKWVEHAGPYVESLKQKKEGTALYHCIIYLAPGDYHRFHSPAVWKPVLRRHFHGELLSVSPKVANWVPGLFALNERAAYIGEWEHGFFSYTAVGKYRTICRARADKKFQKIRYPKLVDFDAKTNFESSFIEIYFPVKVARVGFWVNPSLGNVSFLAADTNFGFSGLNETVLETGTGTKGNFVGISRSTADIGGFKIFGSGGQAFTIDDFSYGTASPVPETAHWALMLAGLAALSWRIRRR